MNLIQSGTDFYMPVTAGPWEGYSPVKANKVEKISHRWKGHKIPMQLVNQIKSFFEWSYKETKSEAIIHAFYHDEHGWALLVLPQKGYTGMSVRLLEDHENRIPTYQRLGEGWTPMSTWHHHCSASAFQSSTDRDDELTKEGLHITLGNIGSARYSLHARTSFRKSILDAKLDDWFELDEQTQALVPVELHAVLLNYRLVEPDDATPFPDWWKENVIKTQPVYVGSSGHAVSVGVNGVGSGNSSGKSVTHWRSWDNDNFNYEDDWRERYGYKGDAQKKPEPKLTFKEAVAELMHEHQTDPYDLMQVVENPYFEMIQDMCELMKEHNLTIHATGRLLEDIADEDFALEIELADDEKGETVNKDAEVASATGKTA